jgi:hypothetical protein
VVFANRQIIYPKGKSLNNVGFSVNVYPRDKVTYELFDDNYVRVSPTSSAQEGDRIMLTLTAL